MILVIIIFQNYFWMYEKFVGMIGMVKIEEEEFCNIYNMQVVMIFINKFVVCDDCLDLIYCMMEGKFKVVVEDVVQCYMIGQFVFVGMVVVEIFELIFKLFKNKGILY